MTSVSLTEEEVFRIISKPSTFDDIVSKLWEQRKDHGVKPGSLSTISRALKSLLQKGYASYDVMDRTWRITALGHWIMSERLVPSEPTSALKHLTQPLLVAVEDNPQKLIELLPTMFVNSFAKRGLSKEEELMLKQTEIKLTLFIKEYPAAIEAIWGECVEHLIGGFSALMAAILLHRASLAPDYRTQAAAEATISTIVDRYFKSLSAELGEILTKSLADLNKLAAQDRQIKTNRKQTAKKTGR